MSLVNTIRVWAKRIKRDVMTLWFARTHPDTPWHAKLLGAFVLAYALSPIDLIPDFIPILGYIDDVILLPVLIWLTVRQIPAHVLSESRLRAEAFLATSAAKPRSRIGAVTIITIWAAATLLLSLWLFNAWRS